MSSIQVRPFRRSDRDQLTQLVNAHAEAVVPAMGVSVNTVLASLERQPGEFIEDPWVAERITLVAEQQNRVTAAAHLLRYLPGESVGQDFRDAGEIRWLLFWPGAPAGNPYWADAAPAARQLMLACLAQLEVWGVVRQLAGGELPVHGVYGVPEQWPHIRALYRDAGFTHTGHTEIVYLARVADLPQPASLPLTDLAVRRSAGINGCRLSAVLGQQGRIAAAAWEHGCSGTRPTGSSSVTSTGSWTTPGSRAPIRVGSATTTTGRSSRPRASANLPAPSAAGAGG